MTNNMATQQEPTYLKGLNPEQREAVMLPRDQGVRVVAGAGTGKTHLISHRYVRIIDELYQAGFKSPQQNILAITFTVKAAQEMQSRIHNSLWSMGFGGLSPDATISNYHGFCQKVLRENALKAGLSPDFKIISGLEKIHLFDSLIHGIVNGHFKTIQKALSHEGLSEDIPHDIFSPKALAKIFNDATALNELFETIRTLGIIDIIKSSGLNPKAFFTQSQNQTIHFSKALSTIPLGPFQNTEEQSWQLDKHFKQWCDNDWQFVGTESERNDYNTRKRASKRGYDPDNYEHFYQVRSKFLTDFKHHDEAVFPKYNFTKKNFNEYTGDLRFVKPLTDNEIQTLNIITALYALYQYTLQHHNRCDFDDIINRTTHTLETHSKLREQYQSQFESIIVDEFQDSNGAQLKLIRQLMRDDTTNITVVGDLKQSIYGFRHAQPENLDLIFQHTDGTSRPHHSIALQTNYRSKAPILHVANHLAEEITHDPAQQLRVSQAQDIDNPLPVTWVTLGVPQPDGTTKKGEPKFKKPSINDMRASEARFIAIETARLLTGQHEKTYQPKDIAVLVGGHQKAEEIEAALRALGIPALKQQHRRFFSEPIILDAMAALRLLQNPYDEISLTRLLEIKLNQHTLLELATYRKENKINLFEALQALSNTDICPNLSLDTRTALVNLSEIILNSRKQLIYLDFIQVFINLAGHLCLIEPNLPAPEEITQRALLTTFKKLLYQFLKDSYISPSLSEVIETLTHFSENPKDMEVPVSLDTQGENAVRILTTFVAKGLEFPVVFAAYTVNGNPRPVKDIVFEPQNENKAGMGLFLSKYQHNNTLKKLLYKNIWKAPRDEAEQKRLFYVALTRAEERLYVIKGIGAPNWPWTESKAYQQSAPKDTIKEIVEADAPDLFKEQYGQVNDPSLIQELNKVLNNTTPQTQETVELKKKADSNAVLSTESTESKTLELRSTDVVPPKVRLSFSAIKTFQQCPTKYYLKYQWRLPEPPNENEDPSPVIARAGGSCIHTLIETSYRYEGKLPIIKKEQIIEKALEEWAQTFPEKTKQQAQRIQNLYETFTQSKYSFKRLTQAGFEVRSEHELYFKLPNKDKKHTNTLFQGSIDLLLYQPKTGEYSIIDFKTDEKPLKQTRLEDYFEQLALYRKGIQSTLLAHHPERSLRPESLKLAHLRENTVDTYPFQHKTSDPDAEFLDSKITEATESIQKQHIHSQQTQQLELPERPKTTYCAQIRCPYIAVCPKSEKRVL